MSDLIVGLLHVVDFATQVVLGAYDRLTGSEGDAGDDSVTDESDGEDR